MKIAVIAKTIQNYLKNGARFVSFMYQSKGTGEVSIYTVSLGVNIDTAYRADLKTLRKITPVNIFESIAKEDIIKSLKNSLEQHAIGKANFNYKVSGVYISLGYGIKLNKNNGEIHIEGFVINKETIKPSDTPFRESSSLIIQAKRSLGEKLKSRKYRNFILNPERISGIKLSGKILEIQNEIPKEKQFPYLIRRGSDQVISKK